MRTAVALIAASLVLTAAAGAAASSQSRPTSADRRGAPLTLRGAGFLARERVAVRVAANGTRASKRLRATAAGGFAVRFDGVSVYPCAITSIVAVAASGRSAAVKLPPAAVPAAAGSVDERSCGETAGAASRGGPGLIRSGSGYGLVIVTGTLRAVGAAGGPSSSSPLYVPSAMRPCCRYVQRDGCARRDRPGRGHRGRQVGALDDVDPELDRRRAGDGEAVQPDLVVAVVGPDERDRSSRRLRRSTRR